MPALAPTMLAPLLTLVREADNATSCGDTCVRNWKIGFAAILVVEGLLFAHLIFPLRRFFAKSPGFVEKTTLYGHAVSAGIFLATGFMHILPEAIELIAGEHSTHGGDSETSEDHDEDHDEQHAEGEPHSDHRVLLFRALAKLATREEDDDNHKGKDHADAHDDHEDEGGHKLEFPWAMFILLMSFYFLFFLEKIVVPVILKNSRARAAAKLSDEEASRQGLTDAHDHDHGIVAPEDVENMGKGEGEKLPGVFSMPFLIVLIQVLGLSAHSLFESMALGLGSSITTIANIFIATVTHRWATALAISVVVSRKVSYFAFLVLVAAFTLVVPIGVGIGAGVSGISETVQGVLFAVSAGTFLYIGVIEGLGAAFSPDNNLSKPLLFMFTLLGSAFIIVTTGILVAAKVEH